MASANTQSARKNLISVHMVQIKAQISGRMASIGTSDVVTVSVYSEKTRLKKLMKIIDGFWRVPESDFRFETKDRKVMVDFKFDALYR